MVDLVETMLKLKRDSPRAKAPDDYRPIVELNEAPAKMGKM
jgi:hypothetical protein